MMWKATDSTEMVEGLSAPFQVARDPHLHCDGVWNLAVAARISCADRPDGPTSQATRRFRVEVSG